MHRARLMVKVYRYQLEVASLLGVPTSRAELPELRRVQQSLGAVTDLSLLLTELERFTSRYPRAGQRLEGVQKRLKRERRQRFASAYGNHEKQGESRRGA